MAEPTVPNVIIGTIEDDDLFGTALDDTIYGLAGSDLIVDDEGGNDTIITGDGLNVVEAGTGNDFVLGGIEDDEIYGEEGNDNVYAGDGLDIIDGGDGNDFIYGEEGDDTIDGGAGDDILLGEAGADTLTGGFGSDFLSGGDDDDIINSHNGRVGSNVIERDEIYGGAGADTINLFTNYLGGTASTNANRDGSKAIIMGFNKTEDILGLLDDPATGRYTVRSSGNFMGSRRADTVILRGSNTVAIVVDVALRATDLVQASLTPPAPLP